MVYSMSRRAALGAAGAGLSTLMLPKRAFAAPAPVRASIVPIWDVAPFVVAGAQGYMAAENLEASITPAGGPVGIAGLMSGAFEVAYSNSVSVLIALERGIDVRIFAEGSPIGSAPPDPGGLMKRRGASFRNGKDLEGKTVSVSAKRDLQWLVLRAWIRSHGGDPDKVNYREVPHGQAIDAIKGGAVDAGLVLDPFFTVAQEELQLELFGWPFETMRNGAAAFWFVRGETADKDPDYVNRLIRAYRRGVDWVGANMRSEAYFKTVSSLTKIDPKLLARLNITPPPRTVDRGRVDRIIKLMLEEGTLKTNIDIGSKIFPAALQ